jgi:hypothetical protein
MKYRTPNRAARPFPSLGTYKKHIWSGLVEGAKRKDTTEKSLLVVWNQCKFQQRILDLDESTSYSRTSGIYMKYAGINTGSVVCRTDNSARPFQGDPSPIIRSTSYSVKRALVGFYFDLIHSLDRIQYSTPYTTVHSFSLLQLHSTSYSNLDSTWQVPSGLRSE